MAPKRPEQEAILGMEQDMTASKIDHRAPCTGVCMLVLLPLVMAIGRAAAQSPSEYYTEPPIYGMRPNPNAEVELGPIGATGIEARIYKGVAVTVEGIQPDTPAAGRFSKGDIIVGVNGVSLKGKNPLVALGTALTKAEATDGVLAFDIKRGKQGEAKKVTVTIPVLGAYSKTFPLKCDKSRKIIKKAAAFYAGEDRLKKHSFLNALACLFLLSTGDDQYVPRVKEYFSQFLTKDGKVTGIGEMTWDNGYNGIACGEYYLRTGDKSVLPILQSYCDDAKRRQYWGKGWTHWGQGINPGYEGAGGLMNAAGNQMLTTLLMGKECGVNVDAKTLQGALKFWYSFAGHGAIPVSDTRPWFAFRSAGRDGATAAAMQIGSGAQGDVHVYKKAKEYLAMSVLTSWPSRAYNWEVIWHSLAGALMLEYNPDMYYRTQQRFRWSYDLYRQASGAFWFPPGHASLDGTEAGISLALAFTAPLKTLRITGAPRSMHAKDFTLPERLWGTKADEAFLTCKHSRDFHKYGEEEEIHVPFQQLPVHLRLKDVSTLPLNTMLKNVRHARYSVRLGAARALRMRKLFGELEKLLRDPDPRLRRAGLDGITDYRPWCGSLPWGRNPLKPEDYTPAMVKGITAVLADPKEAWFVTDGALLALHNAPVGAIEQNIPRILPWTTHEDWWLRESAFMALMGLQKDDALFLKYLPTLIDAYVKEYYANPNMNMRAMLIEALQEKGSDSPAGTVIIAGLVRAVLESKVLPDVGENRRSQEGVYNVIQAALACSKHAPEAAVELAEALARGGRLKRFETGNLVQLLSAQDGKISDRFVGLYPALAAVTPQERKRLADILFNDFRPELMKRLEGVDKKAESAVIDMIVDLTKLKRPISGWQAIGTPKPAGRVWRYHSVDPLTGKDKLHPRVSKRFRDIALPAGMEKWYLPEFDDGKWKSGRSPIGVGVFKAHGHGRMWTATPDHSFKNNSDWGGGEFLLMRSTFNVTDLDFDYYRIKLLSDQGYHIYLNGKKIHSFVWFQHFPRYEKIVLTDVIRKHLKKGANTLAVYCNVRYEKDKETEQYHAVGQMDISIEGMKREELGLKK